LNDIAEAESLAGDCDAAERHFNEALRIARAINDCEGIAAYTGNLAGLAMVRGDWSQAETLGIDALLLSEAVGRVDLIARDCNVISEALVRQGRKTDALAHAHRAVDIYARLGSPKLPGAREILTECEN
jgi:tetratricopeptide (TPR) repeat protein